MNTDKTFMSLSKISYGYDLNPKWASEKWLSEPTTLEFISLWESLHNLDFKKDAFIELCSNALSHGGSPNVEELKSKSKIKGMFVDKNFNEGIYLHKDIAMDFASWASPSFRTFCLLLMNNGGCNIKFNFNSEEDFVIGSKTLAEITKKQALENYQKSAGNFVYNCNLLSC